MMVFFWKKLWKILIWQKFSRTWESDFKLFLFDNYALNMTLFPKIWFVKSFGFQNMLHICTENQFVIIDIIGWVSIKESLNNSDFVMINNGSVNNCDFTEKGISRSWKVGIVKEVMSSIFDCCAAATKRINSI